MELCSTAQEFKQTAEIKLLGLFVEMGAEALVHSGASNCAIMDAGVFA